MQEWTDAELAARCRAGDDDAWRELVDRFSRYVHAIATQGYRLHGDEAEDVFQDVFARAYERLESLRSNEALRPWIGQLTRRLCIDRIRAARPESAGEDTVDLEAEDVLARIDEALDVHVALAALSSDCREILDRFFCRDESYRTIGEALELPSVTIASRISRCLERLRAEFEGRSNPPFPVKSAGDAMTDTDEVRLAELLRSLPPAPRAWVQAAYELPRARRELDQLDERARADEVFRKRLIADLESALDAAGLEPNPAVVAELRKRLST